MSTQQVRFAPTISLPILEVEANTGPGTNYPFGRFDLTTTLGALQFDLFSALAARITVWNMSATASYARRRDVVGPPPTFDLVTANMSGSFTNAAGLASVGPADVQIGDVESYSNGPFVPVWSNPHGSNVFPAEFAAKASGVVALPAWDEDLFAIPDVRMVCAGGGQFTGPGDLTTESAFDAGHFLVSLGGAMIYNQSQDGVSSGGGPFGPFFAHSYRSRRWGYVALLFYGSMTFVPSLAGNGFNFSTHIPSLKISPSATNYTGAIGTFTVQWPHPLAKDRPAHPDDPLLMTLSCPIYASPTITTETSLDYAVDITMTPSTAHAYGGIYNTSTGAPLRCPLN